MSNDRHPTAPMRDVPVDWEALEDAFENNAPEVHSYLDLTTGEVLRVVDGVADPQMHARISADPNYLRIDPVSSREQYRWMERFSPMVDDAELRGKLAHAIDGALGTSTLVSRLEAAAAELDGETEQAVDGAPAMRAALQSLEQQYDWIRGTSVSKSGGKTPAAPSSLPAGSEVLAHVEALLREHRRPDGDRAPTS